MNISKANYFGMTLLCSLIPCVSLFAQPPAPILSQAKPSGKPAEENPALNQYYAAAALLQRGRNYERATSLLQAAVRSEPQNRTYQIALGCALASRAASLALAASRLRYIEEDQAKYKTLTTAWEIAQKDRKSPAFGKPHPLPPVLRTKDDGLPFTLTKEAAAQGFKQRALAAQSAWDAALRLSSQPYQKSEALSVRGWGQRLLRRFGHNVIKDEELPDNKTIVEDFEAASKIAHRDARIWESLGDARLGDDWKPNPLGESQTAIAAYRRSLELNSSNANLWYRLYEIYREKQPEQAEAALRQAALAEPDNAYGFYCLAVLLFAKTPLNEFDKAVHAAIREGRSIGDLDDVTKKVRQQPATAAAYDALAEAVLSLERGNAASRYTIPYCSPPVPVLLASAWRLRAEYWFNPAYGDEWLSLTRAITNYTRIALQEHNNEAALRAANAALFTGARLMKNLFDLPLPIESMSDLIDMETGVTLTSYSYAGLQSIYEQMGDIQHTRQSKAAKDDLDKKWSDWCTAFVASRDANYMNR